MNESELKNQQNAADKFYKNNPERAMRIAMGDEQAPDDIMPAAIYGKVCSEVEKSEDIDTCMMLANSHDNSEISNIAQHLKFRNPNSAIEKMKEVVNARRKAFEKTLPKDKTYKMAVEEEKEKIKKEIKETKPSEKEFENFIESLGEQ